MLTGVLLLRITARVHPTLGCMGITPATMQEGTAGPCHLPAMEICCWQRRQQFWWLHFSLFYCKSAVCKCNLCARNYNVHPMWWCFVPAPSGLIAVLLGHQVSCWTLDQFNGEVWGWTLPNWGLFCESVGAAVLEGCRDQRHHAALMLLVSFLFVWSELTPRILQS